MVEISSTVTNQRVRKFEMGEVEWADMIRAAICAEVGITSTDQVSVNYGCRDLPHGITYSIEVTEDFTKLPLGPGA
jgi:hypothetical protein